MYDVVLYGNLITDYIFDGEKNKTQIGAMGNCWSALTELSPKLDISIEPTEIGSALVYVNKNRGTRICNAKTCLETRIPTIQKSRWSHILYINCLKDIDFISKLGGIISADSCKGRWKSDIKMLEYIDYLFISDEDLVNFDLELIKYNLKGWLIIHHKSGSKAIRKKELQEINPNLPILSNVNVLGAGDFFASSFIKEMLSGTILNNSLLNAHNYTYQFLKNNG